MKEITPLYLVSLVRADNDCTLREAIQAVNGYIDHVRNSVQPPADLRDGFAMQVMPTLVAAGVTMPEADRMSLVEFDARIAARAYAIADAMLEARKSEH